MNYRIKGLSSRDTVCSSYLSGLRREDDEEKGVGREEQICIIVMGRLRHTQKEMNELYVHTELSTAVGKWGMKSA